MPFRLNDREKVQEAFSRCATEQLDRAIHDLSEGIKSEPEQAIHDARKALKMERSLLRLVRASLPRGQRRRENAALRDAARRLSSARDAAVLVHVLDDLAEHDAGEVPKPTFEALRARFGASNGDAALDVEALALALGELLAVRQRAPRWQLRQGGFAAMRGGLRRSYKRGRDALKRAKADPTVENLHEWRKRAKDLWYHLRLLEPVTPHTVSGQVEDAHLLADLLGDDHDLAVLRESLVTAGGDIDVDVDAVVALVDHRREQLQRDAFLLGRRVYAESPKTFVRRLRRYWKAWRVQTRIAAAERPAEPTDGTRASATARVS